MGEWDFGAVHELVDEQEIANLQRVFHAAARNLECFDEERPNQREQDDGNGEDLCPLPDEIERGPLTVELAQCFHSLHRRDRTRWLSPTRLGAIDSLVAMDRY